MDPYKELEAEAIKRGVTLYEVCLKYDIDYSAVYRWKNAPPKTIQIFNNMMSAIKEYPVIKGKTNSRVKM